MERLEGLLTISTPAPLGNETLRSIGMIIWHGSWCVLGPSFIEQPLVGGEDTGEDSNSESHNDSLISSADVVRPYRSEIQELRVKVQ